MLSVQGLSKGYGAQVLLDDVSFVVAAGERVGVVGRNGHGKTTLFRIVLGDDFADSGSVTVPKGYTLGHLSQHISMSASNVLDEACTALRPNADGWVETYKAEAILSGLGFTSLDLARPPGELSGGFQVRLELAKVLLAEPHLLLLDEPTNYLDITSMRWLETFLRQWPGELLLITHDRAFMDQVCTHVLGIHRTKVRKVAGDTQKYYEQVAADEETYANTVANQERRREEAEQFIRRFRAKATKAKAVQSRVKALDRMGDVSALQEIDTLEFEFTPAPFPGKQLLAADGLSFGFVPGDPLVDGLSLSIGPRDRIGVVGPNGRGKTTLLNLLAGELEPWQGSVKTSPNTRVGYFGQTNVDRLDPEKTVEEEVLAALVGPSRNRARSLAGRMMFEGDAALKKVSVLSGGERARVLLAKILARPANLLLLDEPTNHLDMDSCDALSEAVRAFHGAVVVVTHDEAMLHACVEKLVVFDASRAVFFDGTYAEFLARVGWDSERDVPGRGRSGPAGQARPGETLSRKDLRRQRAVAQAERNKALKPLERRVREAEKAIGKAEARMAELEGAIEAASATGESIAVSDLAHEWADVQQRCEETYEALFAATEELDALKASIEGQAGEAASGE